MALSLVSGKLHEHLRPFTSAVWSSPVTPPAEFNHSFGSERAFDNVRPVTPDEARLIAVVGVGYVGVHLVELFAPKYKVIAFDISAKRLESLQEKFSQYPAIIGTTDTQLLKDATHFLIAVPTVVRPDRSIDLSHIKSAIKTVYDHARPGAVVVIESSVSVGMTRELLTPLIQEKQLKAGMSPEVCYSHRKSTPISILNISYNHRLLQIVPS